MKILAVVGSQRKKGNTSVLIQQALNPFKEQDIETELIFLGDYDIKGCNGCGKCQDSFECIIKDDMQKIYPKILEANALILGSPTYFYNITADMKAFIDRCYCFEMFAKDDRSVWMGINEVLGGKYASVIAVCEQSNKEDMGYTAEAMKKPLEALGYRVISVVKTLNLFAEGEALKNEKALNEAKQAGEKLLKTLELKHNLQKKLDRLDLLNN